MTDNIVEATTSRYVDVYFCGKRTCRTPSITQTDYGRIYRFCDLNLPSTFEMHFSNSQTGTSKRVLGSNGEVDIPTEFIVSGQNVYAFIVLHETPDDGETRYTIISPVTAKGPVEDSEPTPVEQDIITQAIAALNSGVETVHEIAEGIPEQIDTALAEAKASGEFDGADGVSPTVTVQDITGGHRVTITDAEGNHTFDVMDGQGGGGTSDYADLTNKPQINGVTLTGDKSLSNLGAASAEDVAAKYTKPASGIPSTDLAQAVQTSLTKADTALQTAPVSSVNNKTGAVVLTASDVGAGTYSKPSGGIPASDLAAGIVTVTETVIGTTPTINAQANHRYLCGECTTLDITLPANGCVDVVFESGSTPTVLTVTPPTGVTVKWANGFDPTALEANTTYEINIMDGLGVAVGWT